MTLALHHVRALSLPKVVIYLVSLLACGAIADMPHVRSISRKVARTSRALAKGFVFATTPTPTQQWKPFVTAPRAASQCPPASSPPVTPTAIDPLHMRKTPFCWADESDDSDIHYEFSFADSCNTCFWEPELDDPEFSFSDVPSSSPLDPIIIISKSRPDDPALVADVPTRNPGVFVHVADSLTEAAWLEVCNPPPPPPPTVLRAEATEFFPPSAHGPGPQGGQSLSPPGPGPQGGQSLSPHRPGPQGGQSLSPHRPGPLGGQSEFLHPPVGSTIPQNVQAENESETVPDPEEEIVLTIEEKAVLASVELDIKVQQLADFLGDDILEQLLGKSSSFACHVEDEESLPQNLPAAATIHSFDDPDFQIGWESESDME